AIHEVPGFGPALADGARAIFGPGPVAWAEDAAYSIADRINRLRYRDAKPRTYWEENAVQPAPSGPVSDGSASSPIGADSPSPPTFAPPFDHVAAEGDGK